MSIQAISVLVLSTVWIPIDLYLYFTNQPTISQWIWKFSKKYPAFPFLIGFLMGHLFA